MTKEETQPAETVIPIATLLILTEIVGELTSQNKTFGQNVIQRLNRCIEAEVMNKYPDSKNLIKAFKRDIEKLHVEK